MKAAVKMVLLWALVPAALYAASFAIVNRNINADFLADAEARAAVNQAIDLLENEVNDRLNIPDQQDFLRAMGQANLLASRGLGVDYASNPQIFSTGISLGLAANPGPYSYSDLNGANINFRQGFPGVGAAAQASLMAGYHLGQLFNNIYILRDSLAFVNFLSMQSPSAISDEIFFEATNIGLHLQYDFIKAKKIPIFELIQWGGVDITSGIDYSYFKIAYREDFDRTVAAGSTTLSSTTYSLSGNFAGPGEISVQTRAVTLPLEVSSNLSFFYFLSFYGGIGFDLVAASSSSTGTLTGPVTVTASDESSSRTAAIGTGVLQMGDKTSLRPVDLRLFAGLQINIWVVRLFAQANYTSNRSLGAVVGLRVAY